MKKIIITLIFALTAQFSFATEHDSIKALVADFDSVVQVAEKDYAAFKFKVTSANRKKYKAFKKSLIKDIKKQRRTWQDAVCAYVVGTIYEHPKKAALIIDNMVASSGEQSVLNTRLASHRTTIYGRDNTVGCIDTGNCLVYESTRRPLIIQYSTTYSTRYEKGTNVDLTGIVPDVRITLPYPKQLTDNIDEWVLWVAEDMKK